jgi:aspartate aminotransferase
MAVMAVVAGSVILCRPSWVTYRPQARLFGREVLTVPAAQESGGVPDPEALRGCIRVARRRGSNPGLLVLTLPDNPTGTVAAPDLVHQLCRTAEDEGILIVSDEIYRDILHDPGFTFVSPAELAPQNTVVTTGLSKNHALGGWRIGLARFPQGAGGTRLRTDVEAVASEVWSCAPGPMQDVAQLALQEPPEIVDHLERCARLHAAVSASVYEVFRQIGAHCLPPQGGFYVYPDLEPLRGVLASRGISDSDSLQRVLLEEFGLAVLGGHHFGDDPRALRFRVATSLLYGDSRLEREESVAASRPLELSHITKNISRIDERLRKLTHQ